jgi:hypothetical protein
MFDQQLSVSTMNVINNETTTIINQFIQVIAQQHLQKVIDEKQKILHNRDKFEKPLSVDTIITSIENRQINMIQRTQYNIEQQLKTLLVNPYSSA